MNTNKGRWKPHSSLARHIISFEFGIPATATSELFAAFEVTNATKFSEGFANTKLAWNSRFYLKKTLIFGEIYKKERERTRLKRRAGRWKSFRSFGESTQQSSAKKKRLNLGLLMGDLSPWLLCQLLPKNVKMRFRQTLEVLRLKCQHKTVHQLPREKSYRLYEVILFF